VAEPRLIAAFLTELRYSAARLANIDDVVAEAEDHLLASVEAGIASGRSQADAEAQALARFGSAPFVAHVFIEEAKRGGAVSTRLTRRAGLAAMLSPLLMIVGAFGNEAVPASEGALHGVFVSVRVDACGALGDPLMPLDPILQAVTQQAARDCLVARYDHDVSEHEWPLGYRWDIVLTGTHATWMEPSEGDDHGHA
jgi:hypothetical protein